MMIDVPAGTTSHPVDWALPLVTAYRPTWPATELHKAGCSHSLRRDTAVHPWAPDTRPLEDDWFAVAPCARARKAR